MHCDDYIEHPDTPNCLACYLIINRLPAVEKHTVIEALGEPKCFATHKGKRVRLVMASRMGDVGITTKLESDCGYDERVSIDDLSDFSSQK